MVAIGEHVQQALRTHVSERESGPLLVTRDGGRLSPRGVQQLLVTMAKRAGIDHLSPHDLRRSCATSAVAAGAQLDDVRVHLGHALFTTTQRYLRADPLAQSRSVVAALGQ